MPPPKSNHPKSVTKIIYFLFIISLIFHLTSPAACGEVPTHWKQKKSKLMKTITTSYDSSNSMKMNKWRLIGKSKGRKKVKEGKKSKQGKKGTTRQKVKQRTYISPPPSPKTRKGKGKKKYYDNERKSEDYYIKEDHYQTYESTTRSGGGPRDDEDDDDWRSANHDDDDWRSATTNHDDDDWNLKSDDTTSWNNARHNKNKERYHYPRHESKGKGKGGSWKPSTRTIKPPSKYKRLAVNMIGSTVGERLSFPETSEQLQLLCFNDLPLYDLFRNVTIGKANNCISFKTKNQTSVFQLDIISETTIFDIKDGDCDANLTFVLVPNIIPKRGGLPGFIVSTTKPQAMNNIVYGDGCGFTEDTIGSVRSSGFILVNVTTASFSFDYIYVVDFDKKDE